MAYRSYIPGPPLGQFVERLFLFSETLPHHRDKVLPSGANESVERILIASEGPAHPRELILPNGSIALVVNLRDEEIRVHEPLHPDGCRRLPGAVVAGAYGGFFGIDRAQHPSMVGVLFRPGGAFPFLGMPACELADAHVELEALWGRPAVELRERLCASATTSERFALVEQSLAVRLNDPPARHGAVPVALDAFEQFGAGVRVRDVARRVGLSQRRFIQVFAAEVGMTPKLYGRVRRFQQARALVRGLPTPDWARVATECGYFDQSHLIRDFRAFSGLTPEAYLRQRSEYVLHTDVPQAG